MSSLLDIVREKAIGVLFTLLGALLITAATSFVTLNQIRLELNYMGQRLDQAAQDRYTGSDARRDQQLTQTQINDMSRRLSRLEGIHDRPRP